MRIDFARIDLVGVDFVRVDLVAPNRVVFMKQLPGLVPLQIYADSWRHLSSSFKGDRQLHTQTDGSLPG